LVEFQVDGTLGSAVVGLFGARIQPRAATPRPTWNPDVKDDHDYLADWHEVPETIPMGNGFRAQWEDFIRHVVEDGPHPYDFRSGARGVRLAELAARSSVSGTRVEVPVR
jgi:predicted dehydrogenase